MADGNIGLLREKLQKHLESKRKKQKGNKRKQTNVLKRRPKNNQNESNQFIPRVYKFCTFITYQIV